MTVQTEKGSFDITSDKDVFDIPLRIEKGKTASYIVKVDGKTLAEKEVAMMMYDLIEVNVPSYYLEV